MATTLNKQALVSNLQLHDLFADVPKTQILAFVEDFFGMISTEVIAGNTVSISGFGKFEPFTRSNGVVTPKFRPFTAFKDALAA